jgi:hypothetical protein
MKVHELPPKGFSATKQQKLDLQLLNQINMKKTRFTPAVLAVLALAAGSASAAVTFSGGTTGTISELSNSTETFFSGNQSSTDLLTGITASAVSGWNLINGSTVAQLTDGIHGVTFASAGSTIQGTWTTVGATATYNLGGGTNNLGFNITSIRSIAAWVNAGFGEQAWTLATQPFGGGAFTNVVTTSYLPFAAAAGGASQVLVTDMNITGIQAVRITANAVTSTGGPVNTFVFREFDVLGASTIPEPSSALLGAIGVIALLRRRR